jgi:hypothetical protein
MIRCRIEQPPIIWDDILQFGCKRWGKNSLVFLLCRLIFGAVVYSLWHTRNELRHDGSPSTEEQILKESCGKFVLDWLEVENSLELEKIFLCVPCGICLLRCLSNAGRWFGFLCIFSWILQIVQMLDFLQFSTVVIVQF